MHSLCLFCEGHETRRQACLLLKESMFVTNMFEIHSRTTHFFLEQLLPEAAKAIKSRLSIMYVWVMEDKTDEGHKLHLKFVESIQLLVS